MQYNDKLFRIILYMAPNEPAIHSEIAQRTRWFIRLSWLLLPAIGIPSLITDLIDTGWSYNTKSTLALLTLSLAANAVFFLLSRAKKRSLTYFRVLAGALIAFDITLITFIIFARGGLESRSVILYIFPILVSAPIYGRRAVYVSAAAALLLYNTQLLADYFGVLHPLDIAAPSLHVSAAYVFQSIAYISSILLLCAVIADYITRLLIAKERQASQNLAGLNKAQHIAKMGSWEWDCTTDKVVYSDGFYSLLHDDPYADEKAAHGILGLVHHDDLAMVKRTINKSLKNGKPYRFDVRLQLPNQPVMYVHCEGEPIVNKAGKVIKLFGTMQDTTDSRQLDLAKSDFVAIASHQLRTPASSVKQYIGMLLSGYAGDVPEIQRKMLQTAYESNERQIIIVNDLLYVAQLESGNLRMKPEIVNIVALLKDIIEELTPRYQASEQTITYSTKLRNFYCKVDATLMRMVIENLIDNAHKYSHANQRISVKFACTDKQLLITISDQGVGIAPEDLKKLFQKFSRVENALSSSAGGSGLGLYLSYKLVTLHGGEITVSSEKGKGSTFTISLPRALAVQKRRLKTPTQA